MAILSATALELKFNERVILDKASLTIQEHDRIGMVGRNGTGKSTFLKIISGAVKPDAGEITKRRDLIIGYLPQEFALDSSLNVIENIRSGAGHIIKALEDFENPGLSAHQHEQAETMINLHDGWMLESRIATAMDHLNCPDPERDINHLSGGEKRRVALCRAIISQPDLLILDEPTNHLDTESIEWLGEFLENYPGAFLLVTHDRYFLDRITNTIAELSNGTIFPYTGNYTDYLISKAEREASAEVNEHKRQMFLRRELEWVRRGPKARTTKSKSRLDKYFEIAGKNPPEIDKDVDLVIPPPPPLANRIVELTNVGMEMGGKRLFSNLTLNFEAGQRIGITGRNGLGKTTLLRIIMEQIQPMEGTVKMGMLTKFNYVDQGRLQLNEESTVLDEISDGSEFVIFGEHKLSLRAYLKRFLFTDDRITTQVKYLSGGERSRLLLARILKNGGNFLILDEPTNDLDLPTLRVLEEALVSFPGVVLVVSHDRYFLNRVCTAILAFEGNGKVNYSVGDYEYYLEKKKRAQAPPPPPSRQVAPSKPAPPPPEKKQEPAGKQRKLSFKEQQELAGMEDAIQQAEERIAEIEATFARPEFHRTHGHLTGDLTQELEQTKELLTTLFARWEELEAIKAAGAKS